MALFKISKGLKTNLPNTYNEGYCYFTTDDGKMYIDTKTNDSTGRICLNAAKADSADKLTTNAGSATNPVYFANGIPVKTTYTLSKSVPSNAKFTDTTYSAATTSASGLMTATMVTKLNGIETGANKTTVDSALSSSSTNPV